MADKALGMEPDYAGAQYAKALLLEAAGEDSRKHREAAARLDPERGGEPPACDAAPDPLRERAAIGTDMLANRGNVAGALSHFESLVKDEPGFAPGRVGLGAALTKSGKAGAALAEFEKALEAGTDEADAYAGMGDAYGAMGRHEKARECYIKASSSGSGHGDAMISLARNYARDGMADEALESLDEALRLQPGDSEANTLKGAMLAALGRFGESVPPLREAVRASPGYRQAQLCLGRSLSGAGEKEEALRHFDEASRLAPGDADVHCDKGDALAALSRFREAYDSYSRAAKIEPRARTYADMAMSLCSAHMARFSRPRASIAGKRWHAQAVDLADKAIRMDGKCAYAHFAKSRLLRMADDEKGAQECLRRAADLDEAFSDYASGRRIPPGDPAMEKLGRLVSKSQAAREKRRKRSRAAGGRAGTPRRAPRAR